MKFLAFVDLHENLKYLDQLVLRASQPDIDFIVCAGDLTVFGRNLRYFLKKFNDLGKWFYFIPGNHENDEMLNAVLRDYSNCINLNGKSLKKQNYIFLGDGASGFTLEDPVFRKISRDWYGSYQDNKTILITPGLPFGTKLDLLEKKQVGNMDIRRFIERIKPKIVICGHIHEAAGIVDNIGETKVINPGWEGMVIELN